MIKKMAQYQLVSKHTQKHGKHCKSKGKREDLPNFVERNFAERKPLEVAVSDLTYVKCGGNGIIFACF